MSHRKSYLSIIALTLLAMCGTSIGQEVEDLPDPFIVQLNERAARGGRDLAESIAAFARIGQWKLVDRWLSPLATSNDEAELAQMAQTIGSAILIRISSRRDLSPQAIEAARKMGTAARKKLESKDRMVAAMNGLGGTTDQRLSAMRVLLQGSNSAVAVLVEAAVAAQPKAPRDELLRTMASLGSGGQQALTQLALYGEPQTRSRALQSLVRLDPQGSTTTLLTALHASDSTPAEVQFAQATLMRLAGSVPGKGEAIAVLFADLQRKREAARISASDGQQIVLWSVNENRNGIGFQPALRIWKAYRDAADAGARLRRIEGLRPNVLEPALTADLGYRVMIDPDWGDADQVEAIRASYGSAAAGTGLSRAIATALDNNDDAAAVGLMRMIDESATVLDRNFLLSGDAPELTPLVQATSHSKPRIRYEAASAIARLAPQVPYAGSSCVKRCFGEMRRLTERPIAALVETRPDVIVQQEQILSDLGFDALVVGSVAALERVVARGKEIGLIVSKTQLADFSPIELIDRVRRMPRGRQIPIVFFGNPAFGIDADRWNAVTRLIEQPPKPDLFEDIIIGLDRVPRVPYEEEANPPLAILVETRDEVIERQEPVLEELGYTVTVVKSLEALENDLSEGGDLGLVISAVRLPEVRPEALVNVVRRHPNGKGLLIAFYRESLLGFDAQEWDPFSRRVHYPNTAAAYSSILLDIASTKRMPPLTSLDRQIYRNVAAQVFAQSSDR